VSLIATGFCFSTNNLRYAASSCVESGGEVLGLRGDEESEKGMSELYAWAKKRAIAVYRRWPEAAN
jgi:hypothetical protein